MNGHNPSAPQCYELRIEGHLDQHWSAWFGGLAITHNDDGTTSLLGDVTDQASCTACSPRSAISGQCSSRSTRPGADQVAGSGSSTRRRTAPRARSRVTTSNVTERKTRQAHRIAEDQVDELEHDSLLPAATTHNDTAATVLARRVVAGPEPGEDRLLEEDHHLQRELEQHSGQQRDQ